MKHVYLIIAHDEFEVLQHLIDALDDARNDIFVHIDKKVKQLPYLSSKCSQLYMIENRIDVRWGDISQIRCEYSLFEEAFVMGKYERFHLISGTHLPLKTQHELHEFFKNISDKELISSIYTNSYEANFKLGIYHYFIRNYRSQNSFLRKFIQLLWLLMVRIQLILNIHRNTDMFTQKASNWVSLTSEAVQYVLCQKEHVMTRFCRTFCGDEFFIPYLLNQEKDKFDIIDDNCWLYHDFQGSNPRLLKSGDFEFLIHSNYLFARKFSSSDMAVVNKLTDYLKNKR